MADGSQLAAGSYTINAAYSGDPTFDASSGSIAVTVNAPTSGVTFKANPDPIISATGMGMTTLSWNAPGYNQLVITVGSVAGTPLTRTVGWSGSAQTGTSVTDGLQFFLVDLTSHSSIASVTVRVAQPTSLTSISPPGVEVGYQSFKLQVIGSGFTTSSVVLWGGTKLATLFQNSGSLPATVPASYLTAYETMQVQVDTNGQVSAPLPFTVGNTPYLVNSMMTKSATSSGCQVPTATTSFLYSDPGATVWFSVEGAVAGDLVQVDWYAPGDNHYGSTFFWNPLSSGGSWCFSNTLDISGGPTANMGGDWQVVITWNGARFFMLPFTIVSIPVGYFAGTWIGTTSQGLPMSMTVAADEITSYSFSFNITSPAACAMGGNVQSPSWETIGILGNSFSEFPEFHDGVLSGTFLSSTQASGGFTWTENNTDCDASFIFTWTATKQ
jgi:hypothetical protein